MTIKALLASLLVLSVSVTSIFMVFFFYSQQTMEEVSLHEWPLMKKNTSDSNLVAALDLNHFGHESESDNKESAPSGAEYRGSPLPRSQGVGGSRGGSTQNRPGPPTRPGPGATLDLNHFGHESESDNKESVPSGAEYRVSPLPRSQGVEGSRGGSRGGSTQNSPGPPTRPGPGGRATDRHNSISKLEERKHGFIMAMHYSDQLTGASRNLLSLQCFVGRHLKDVKVVEPFLAPIGSTLGVALSPSFEKMKLQDLNKVKHSDIFDMKEWTDYAKSQHYAPLISWEDFMKTSPKKLILVHHTWSKKHCDETMVASTKEFVTNNSFTVVKQVCLNFRELGLLSPVSFRRKIYGKMFKPSEVVVIFNRWGGIVHRVLDYRISLKRTICHRDEEQSLWHHSQQLSNDVKEYARRYMNETTQYVAVMVRVEYFAIYNNLRNLSADVQRSKLMKCFNSIDQKVRSLKQQRNINSTLLTMDVGKHGSIYFRSGKPCSRMDIDVLNKAVPEFFELMFGKSFTQDMWEDSFESVARFNVPGYIAIMQKELAANSACLLVVGGGTFQDSAKTLYNELHFGPKCIVKVC